MFTLYEKHWTLHVINFFNEQIDILDSSCTKVSGKKNYHKRILPLIQSRFHEVLDEFTERSIPDFSKYDSVLVDVPLQKDSNNDCGFFVMMFLECYFFRTNSGGETPTYYFIDRKSSETEPLQ